MKRGGCELVEEVLVEAGAWGTLARWLEDEALRPLERTLRPGGGPGALATEDEVAVARLRSSARALLAQARRDVRGADAALGGAVAPRLRSLAARCVGAAELLVERGRADLAALLDEAGGDLALLARRDAAEPPAPGGGVASVVTFARAGRVEGLVLGWEAREGPCPLPLDAEAHRQLERAGRAAAQAIGHAPGAARLAGLAPWPTLVDLPVGVQGASSGVAFALALLARALDLPARPDLACLGALGRPASVEGQDGAGRLACWPIEPVGELAAKVAAVSEGAPWIRALAVPERQADAAAASGRAAAASASGLPARGHEGAPLAVVPVRSLLDAFVLAFGTEAERALAPRPDHALAPGDLRFTWQGAARRLPLGPHAAVLDGAPPEVRPLARHLCELLAGLEGPPRAPLCGYARAQAASGAPDLASLFGRLGEVQRWCAAEGLFDLSALVVNAGSQVPGGGHYGRECADAQSWRAYLDLALAARGPAATTS